MSQDLLAAPLGLGRRSCLEISLSLFTAQQFSSRVRTVSQEIRTRQQPKGIQDMYTNKCFETGEDGKLGIMLCISRKSLLLKYKITTVFCYGEGLHRSRVSILYGVAGKSGEMSSTLG